MLPSSAQMGSAAHELPMVVESTPDILFVKLRHHGVVDVDEDDVREVLQDIHLMF